MKRLIGLTAAVLSIFSPAVGHGYIDSPAEQLTLPQMVLEFRSISVIQVEKLDRDRGAILFHNIDRVQGQPGTQTVKHSIKYDGGVPAELKDLKPGSKGVFFSGDGYKRGITLIDGVWYISNYDSITGWWHIAGTAAHYDLNCAYTGTVTELGEAIRKLHRGEDVVVRCRKKSRGADTQLVRYNLRRPARKEVVPAGKPLEAKPASADRRTVDQLLEALKNGEAGTRVEAVEALGRLGKDAKSATSVLGKALAEDKDPFVRRAAAVALGEIGPEASAAVPHLLASLESHYENIGGLIGSESAVALTRIDPEGKVMLPLLLPLLKDKRVEARVKIATQLAIIGPAARGAAPALIEVLAQDKEGDVRYSAAGALASIGLDAKEIVPVFGTALKDSNKFVRLTAARALRDIGPAAKQAIPALQTASNDPDAEVKQAAMEALQLIKPK